MLAAIDAAGVREPARTEMREYFERGSAFLINREPDADNLMHVGHQQGESSE
jgi:hypothetical protein